MSSSSPKTKDQSVMAQIDLKGQLDYLNNIHEKNRNGNEIKNGQILATNDGTGSGSATTGSNSAKSSIRELLQTQKSNSRRKSKSQNRARKALRTITFILGMFNISISFLLIKSSYFSRRFCRLLDSMVNNHFRSVISYHFFYSRHIYSAIHSLCESCKNNWIFSNPMFHCFYFLCYLNSPINPFCYALANQQFKKTFTRILKLDLRRL